MITFTIAGVDKTSLVSPGSLSIQDELNSRNTCSFEMIDESAMYEPYLGASVIIQQDGSIIFAGTIDALEKYTPPGTRVLAYRITCIDYNQLCDRFLIAAVYTNQLAGNIVRAIIADAFKSEGVMAGDIQDGPVIEKAVFNYQAVAECLDELSRLTGFKWNIDYYKRLHFFDRSTYKAPFDLKIVKSGNEITYNSDNFRNLTIRRTRERYRNTQIVRGARATTNPRTESFVGDGKRQTFTLAYPIDTINSLSVNGVEKIAAIQGTPGADWVYTKGSKEISQADGNPPLTSTDILTVYYVGTFPIIAVAHFDNEINERAKVEGGSGIYMDIEYDENLEKESQAQQKAAALLNLYGKLPRLIEYETDEPGLTAGQWQRIDLDNYNIHDEFLIYNVNATDVSGKFLRYRVQSVGSEAPNWIDFFRGLVRVPGRMVIRENEIVSLIRYSGEAIRISDLLTVTSATKPSTTDVGVAEVGFSEVSGTQTTQGGQTYPPYVGLAIVGYSEVAA